jgi:hypothetical protein
MTQAELTAARDIVRSQFEEAWTAFERIGWTGAHNKLEAWQWWHVAWRVCEARRDPAGVTADRSRSG